MCERRSLAVKTCLLCPSVPLTTKVLRPPVLCSLKRYTSSLTTAQRGAAASASTPTSDFPSAKAWWGEVDFLLLGENFPVWHCSQLCSCSPEPQAL